MYFPSGIFLLFVAVLSVEATILLRPPQKCNGGICMTKKFCPTGRRNDPLGLGQHEFTPQRNNDRYECRDSMICCKDFAEPSVKSMNTLSKCGISNPQGLVNNVESNLTYAQYAEFPWTVAIFQKSSSTKYLKPTYVAGGTLIHPKYILTVAHALKKLHQYVARFGEWNMNSDTEIYPTKDIEIEDHIPHPSYQETPLLENDIALAILKENVIYSEHIRPLCLPSASDVFDGQKCIATGWGLDVRTGQPAVIMKRMEMNVIPRAHCQLLLWRLSFQYQLHRNVMCVRAAEDQNTCNGDGGSPLACQRDDGSYVLAGIASWVKDCGRSIVPSGHVNVAKFTHWIHETIEACEQLQGEERKYKNFGW